MKEKRASLIEEIKEFGWHKTYWEKSLEEKETSELKEMHTKWKAIKEEQDRIDAITLSDEEKEIEEYLIKDYNVCYDNNYLKCEEQIEPYFKEDSYDFFDCGQGYSQDEVTVICKIGFKFYKVTIQAEIGSSKQDHGDRLYWVENIEKVTYKEIEKPLPKEDVEFSYSFKMNKDKKNILDSFLKENNFIPT